MRSASRRQTSPSTSSIRASPVRLGSPRRRGTAISSPPPPSNTALPTISGTAQQGQTLSASTGTWSGNPTSFAYQWRRCNTSGSGCADIGSATASSYLLAAADVGSTLRVRVTATNGAGSSSAESAQTAVVSAAPSGVPPGFTSVFTDPGCGGCSVSAITDGLRATIAGAANTLDTAYGEQDFGGSGGVAGRVWVRDVLALAQGQTLSANLAVLQVRDSAGSLVYELYLGSDRILRLYSPAGGLRSTSIVASTGVVVPNNGSSSLVVEVSALKSSSIIVRVDGVDRITLGGLSGGTTGNQRYLRVGSDHYDGSSGQPVTSDHTHVGSSQTTWLGAPGGGPPPPSPPSNTALPTISGTAQQGQTLSASTGTWSGNPTSFAYQWRRCNTSGSGCADIGSATASSYLLAAADVGSTLRVRVTATNGAGSSSAESAQTAVVSAAPSGVPPGFTSVFTDPGCGGCSVSAITDGLRATIAGAANTLDTAYGEQDFGGSGGVAGRVWVRDVLALAQGQTLSGNLAVLQVRDSAGSLVYELYLGSDRILRLYSPAGGLRSTSIVASTGVVVPNNGSSSLVVEVSALKSSSIIVRVDGVDRITLGGLSGGTTGNQRYLRVGSDHYDGSSSQPVTSDHTYVGSSQTTWLGAPGGGPPPPSPPSNTALPTISGTAQQGQTLTASTGTWSGNPTSFAYQWRRCNTSGSGCADIGSATASSYLLAAADVGSTLRVRVTATNGAGSSSAESAQTTVVSAAPSGVPPGFTSVFTDPGCGGCSVSAITDGLRATIAGAANTLDTAYGEQDFGGSGGVAGRVWVRDVLALAQGQTLSANLAVLQVRDSAGSLVYELYLGSDRILRLYSPAGGLRSTSIVASTGVVVPNNGSSSLVVEVSALKSSSIIVRVDGVDRITLGGLSGGTTGNQRYLRVGSDHYDGSSSQPVTSDHTHVGSSQTTWLGAP